MKILINPKNLIPNETWQAYRKVRAIIENNSACFAITMEAGKCIFPGGTCEQNEDELSAIQREIREETGIDFQVSKFHKILELETMYDDAIDYKTKQIKPRHTITTYYYVKTDKEINTEQMNLTEGEIKEDFKISFVDRETLMKMLLEDHSGAMNGKIFDEENCIVANSIIKNR
ncbi:MAG: NUDIX hydrolase [Firmicutes bacterium]|nr:NUDIX hydrolase [Bacillota bacterium]